MTGAVSFETALKPVSDLAQSAHWEAAQAKQQIESHERFCQEREFNTQRMFDNITEKFSGFEKKINDKFFWLFTSQVGILASIVVGLVLMVVKK